MWHCCVSDSCCVQRIKKLENIERVTEPGPRSIKADPPATGKKPAALTPWAQLDAVYQDNLIRAIILPALRRILACVGDRRSMDMVMGKLQASHSLHQRFKHFNIKRIVLDFFTSPRIFYNWHTI